jgi:hypothetical protein
VDGVERGADGGQGTRVERLAVAKCHIIGHGVLRESRAVPPLASPAPLPSPRPCRREVGAQRGRSHPVRRQARGPIARATWPA